MNLRPGLSMVTVLRWLPEYRAEWLRPDLVAGLTLAAYLLPAGIGDASLAGLAPEAGLYACLFSGLVFWLLCSSKHTVIRQSMRCYRNGRRASKLTGLMKNPCVKGEDRRPTGEPTVSRGIRCR